MDNAEMEISKIEARNALEGLLEMIPIYARGVMVYYKSLLDEGFTGEQALKIVLSHGMFPPTIRGGE